MPFWPNTVLPAGFLPRAPTCPPPECPAKPNMETYLGRMFNHGAVMVNIFSWGIGGEAMRNNFFRRATENPEALAAYAKFLRRETLVETAPTGFSSNCRMAADHASQARIPQSPGRLFSMSIQVKSIPLHTILSMLKAGLLLKADHRKPGS